MVIKRKIQIIIDIAMIVLLPLLMAYELIGDVFHEVVGTLMFMFFILHNILNYKWYKALFKGSYMPYRIMSTIINLLLFIIMVSLMVSGIILSKYTFAFLQIDSGAYFLRTIHMIAAYWGYILMSMHLGLHWNIMLVILKKNEIVFRILKTVVYIVFIYGIYAFYARSIGNYMFFQTQFVYFDFNEPVAMFILDYVAIMILFAGVGYYTSKFVKDIK